MKFTYFTALAFFAFAPFGAYSTTLEFPGNSLQVTEEVEPLGSYKLPTGPWAEGEVSIIATEGEILRQVWRIPASNLTSLQLLAPLRDQLTEIGFEVVFDCKDIDCGGFDFRFDIDVAPEPFMHVDLGDYRFLSATLALEDSVEHVSLLVSRRSDTGFVQIIHVRPPNSPRPTLTPSSKSQPAGSTTFSTSQPARVFTDNQVGQVLETDGHVVLEDLYFETGSATLSEGTYSSLADLADYLSANPTRKVALVGHTDAEGSLDANIALSKRRAASVLKRLIEIHDADRNQVRAEGMGFLSPRSNNLTPEGRDRNRRVEVVLTSTQ